MRLHRFYVNKPLGEEIVVESANGQSEEKEILHQWIRVFRYQAGDSVILFSSLEAGFDFTYSLSSLSSAKAELRLISKTPNLIPKRDITLCMALVKKDTFETVVRQATELGVASIIPVTAMRSEKKNLNFERLLAISREAAEQSGRGTIPNIKEISSLSQAIVATEHTVRILGSLHGKEVRGVLDENILGLKPLSVWIGPEGGWTEEEEKEIVASGGLPVKLTETVLKADTAAIAMLSLCSILH
jgi:16S rRNA (uracil1498-N3)-methyltransferase